MFTFEELCGRPVAAADYIALAERFHTVALEGVPEFSGATRSQARPLAPARARLQWSCLCHVRAWVLVGALDEGCDEFCSHMCRIWCCRIAPNPGQLGSTAAAPCAMLVAVRQHPRTAAAVREPARATSSLPSA
jgi:hypothetical protein